MRVNFRSILEAVLLVIISIFWCEFAYHHYVFYFYCPAWPGIESVGKSHVNLTKFLVISDTHVMGPLKSFKIDKWRREWQMKQAFSVSSMIYKPDVIVFMGDLLDEGLTSHDALFEQTCNQFDEIFPLEDGVERIIIPGNHDVGFHDRMIYFPFLLKRFQQRFMTTSSVDLVRSPHTKHLNLVVSNSMSFYNDSCPFCSYSMQGLKDIKLRLEEIRKVDPNNYSPPIFLGHMPLFRKNDHNCLSLRSLESKNANDNVEGTDVIHDVSSKAIIAQLRPRLAISGHTHMQCLTNHQNSQDSSSGFQEITVTSYNHKYAELNPGFLLLTVGPTHHYIKHCNLINEIVVLGVYVVTLFAVVLRLVRGHRSKIDMKIVSGFKSKPKSG